MADAMTPGVVNDPKHNSAAMNAAIIQWSKNRLAKEREINKAIETYVQDLKDDLSRLDKNIKTDTKIGLKYLKAHYKLFKLQEDAKAFMDDDEGNDVLDHLRIVFDALAEGGQLDFVDAMNAPRSEETHADDSDDEPSQAVLGKAFKAGRTAGENGEDGTTNPHAEGSAHEKAWNDGWLEAQTEAVKSMGGGSNKKAAAG